MLAGDVIEWFAEEAKRSYGRIIPARGPGIYQLAIKELGGTGRVHDWEVSSQIRDGSRILDFLGQLPVDQEHSCPQPLPPPEQGLVAWPQATRLSCSPETG